jgi:hypothetical protein
VPRRQTFGLLFDISTQHFPSRLLVTLISGFIFLFPPPPYAASRKYVARVTFVLYGEPPLKGYVLDSLILAREDQGADRLGNAGDADPICPCLNHHDGVFRFTVKLTDGAVRWWPILVTKAYGTGQTGVEGRVIQCQPYKSDVLDSGKYGG